MMSQLKYEKLTEEIISVSSVPPWFPLFFSEQGCSNFTTKPGDE
jgi:hypothetical protein